MTTLMKVEANRKNGKLSTGPKTAAGIAVAKLNAVTHGLRSLSPVLPDERLEEWNDHYTGVAAALAPVGALETELVERVALLMWRLRRVVRYETAVTASGIDDAVARVRGEPDESNTLRSILAAHGRLHERSCFTVQKELDAARANASAFARTVELLRRLPDIPDGHRLDGGEVFALLWDLSGAVPNGDEEGMDIEDHGFLAEVGVPDECRDEPEGWDGWTARHVRTGAKVIAAGSELADAELMSRAVRGAERAVGKERRKVAQLEAELARLSAQTADAERTARGRASLPNVDLLDKVMRYESHLNRQLTQTLHMLERLRAIRDGNPPTPPAAIDVTINGGLVPAN